MNIIKKVLKTLLNPFTMLVDNWDLFMQSLRREVSQKYRGSYLGVLWNFILPLIMMVVYSFVFGVVFKAKWDLQISDSNEEFALILFVGITLFNLFSEGINSAPTLVINNSNYVKKVIYPLNLLSVTNVCGSMIQVFFNIIIIIIAKIIIVRRFDFLFLLFPVVVLPHLLCILGFSWIFSAVGVYIRDVKQGASILSLLFGYATPVFFPLSAIPERLQWIMYINPMTIIVENARRVLIYGLLPRWNELAIIYIMSYVIFLSGFYIFKKLKKGFSDVM